MIQKITILDLLGSIKMTPKSNLILHSAHLDPQWSPSGTKGYQIVAKLIQTDPKGCKSDAQMLHNYFQIGSQSDLFAPIRFEIWSKINPSTELQIDTNIQQTKANKT